MPGMASPPTLSKRLLHLSALAVLASSLLGCRHSPLAARTSAFATAAATTAKNTDDAYDLVEFAFPDKTGGIGLLAPLDESCGDPRPG